MVLFEEVLRLGLRGEIGAVAIPESHRWLSHQGEGGQGNGESRHDEAETAASKLQWIPPEVVIDQMFGSIVAQPGDEIRTSKRRPQSSWAEPSSKRSK